MSAAEIIYQNKNALWDAYKDADPIIRAEIILKLKQQDLWRYWHATASKSGYDLKKAKAPLRDIFINTLPATAPLFGLSLQTN